MAHIKTKIFPHWRCKLIESALQMGKYYYFKGGLPHFVVSAIPSPPVLGGHYVHACNQTWPPTGSFLPVGAVQHSLGALSGQNCHVCPNRSVACLSLHL